MCLIYNRIEQNSSVGKDLQQSSSLTAICNLLFAVLNIDGTEPSYYKGEYFLSNPPWEIYMAVYFSLTMQIYDSR